MTPECATCGVTVLPFVRLVDSCMILVQLVKTKDIYQGCCTDHDFVQNIEHHCEQNVAVKLQLVY